MHIVRSLGRPLVATLTTLGLALGPMGCGGDDGSSTARVPDLTRDFGNVAYGFVTQQQDGGLTEIVLHSDGTRAVLLMLKDGVVDRSQSARVLATVRDAATLQASEGQVNIDGNDSFVDNDVVPASGFIVVADQEIATNDLEIGSVATLAYTFRAVLADTVDAGSFGSLLDPD